MWNRRAAVKIKGNERRRFRSKNGKNGWKLAICAAVLLICAAVVWRGCSSKPANAPKGLARGANESAAIPKIEVSSGSGQSADPLLVLVNEETPLPQDWQVELVNISEDSEEQVAACACDDLTAMTDKARQDGVWFWVTSGYRSVELQQEILDRKIQENQAEGMDAEQAEEDALRTIQKPGYSEHHTGLAVDFNDASDDFEETGAYAWLSQYAAEYGFVQRYQRSKAEITGIDNESWHYRYVGREHALRMQELGLCLEEYLEFLRS